MLCTRSVAKIEVLLSPTDRSAMVLCSFFFFLLFAAFGFGLSFIGGTRHRPRSEWMDAVAQEARGAPGEAWRRGMNVNSPHVWA